MGLWGNTEEPDKPTEAFQGDAAAEEEPAGGAVSTEQLQHKAVLTGGCFLKRGFMELEKKKKMVVRKIVLVVRGAEMWPW